MYSTYMFSDKRRTFYSGEYFIQLTAKHLQKPAMKISELTQLSNLSLNSPPQSQQQQPPAPPAPLTSQQLQQGIKLNSHCKNSGPMHFILKSFVHV